MSRSSWATPSTSSSAAGQVDFDHMLPIADARSAIVVAITALCAVADERHQQPASPIRSVQRYARPRPSARLQVLPLSYIDSHPYGDMVSRIIADVDQFADGLLMGFTQLFTGVLTIRRHAGVHADASIAGASLCRGAADAAFAVCGALHRAAHRSRCSQQQSEARAEQTALVDEMIGNQKVVQAFAHEAAAQEAL